MTPSIAPLRNVAALIGTIETVQSRELTLPGMATFFGPSGYGKTTAVTVAGNEFQAYCVQVKDCWTPTYLAETIMREIGLPKVRGVPAMVDAIGAQLGRSDRPLIIDDAQYLLRKRMIELARDIYESSHAPIILVGEEDLPQALTKWENIYGRLLINEPALPCNMADALYLAPIYCKGVSVSDDLLAAIVEESGGSTRRVAVNLARVWELARRRGTSQADVDFWGDRAFDTGQPPVKRSPKELGNNNPVVRLSREAKRA